MTAATRSLATALWGARFASGLLPRSYTTRTCYPIRFERYVSNEKLAFPARVGV